MPNRTLFEAGCHLVDLCSTSSASCPRPSMHGTRAASTAPRMADAIHLVMLEFSGAGWRRSRSTGSAGPARGTSSCGRTASTRRCERPMAAGAAAARDEAGRAAGYPPSLRAGGVAWSEVGLRGRSSRGTRATRASRPRSRSSGRSWPRSRRAASLRRAAARLATVLRVIEAAYRSAETGQRVQLTRRFVTTSEAVAVAAAPPVAVARSRRQ